MTGPVGMAYGRVPWRMQLRGGFGRGWEEAADSPSRPFVRHADSQPSLEGRPRGRRRRSAPTGESARCPVPKPPEDARPRAAPPAALTARAQVGGRERGWAAAEASTTVRPPRGRPARPEGGEGSAAGGGGSAAHAVSAYAAQTSGGGAVRRCPVPTSPEAGGAWLRDRVRTDSPRRRRRARRGKMERSPGLLSAVSALSAVNAVAVHGAPGAARESAARADSR
jgi:hypothetical protein